MRPIPSRAAPLAIAIVALASCTDASRRIDTSLVAVDVIETAPAVMLEPDPAPLPTALPLAPVLIYLEPLPLPARHVVIAATAPAASRRLSTVQSVEVDVEVQGGAYGNREISAVFVSPQGLVWERQGTLIEARRGETPHAHFSLPVAATFIEEQQLSDTWQITTLDDGVELASATFALEE